MQRPCVEWHIIIVVRRLFGPLKVFCHQKINFTMACVLQSVYHRSDNRVTMYKMNKTCASLYIYALSQTAVRLEANGQIYRPI